MAADDKVPMIEQIPIIDTVTTGIAEIEDLGDGLARLTFYIPHRDERGSIERHVVAKLVIPDACLLPVGRRISQYADQAIGTLLTLVPGNHAAGK